VNDDGFSCVETLRLNMLPFQRLMNLMKVNIYVQNADYCYSIRAAKIHPFNFHIFLLVVTSVHIWFLQLCYQLELSSCIVPQFFHDIWTILQETENITTPSVLWAICNRTFVTAEAVRMCIVNLRTKVNWPGWFF